MNKSIFILVFTFLLFSVVESQEYQQMINSGQYSVQQIQDSAEDYFENRDKGRGTGYKSYKRWEYDALRMQDENGLLKSPSFYYNELERYNSYQNNSTQSEQMRTVANWEQLGPDEWNQTSGWNPGVGRITSIGIDSADDNHIIIGSPTGGVWKTTDGSANWIALTDNLSNIEVYALTIDPVDPNIYYWGSSSGIIFKSTDAGATWNELADTGNGSVNKILIDPTNTSKMFCSTTYGVFKSTNSGVDWSLIHIDSNAGYDIEFKPGDTNTIYASGNSVFKSVDGGSTFEKIQADNSLAIWSQEYVSGTTDWIKSTSNQNASITPKSGSNLALFYHNDFTGPTTTLISPQLDLSTSTAPELKFSYTNVNWEGDVDELRVLYKTGINEAWILLANYSTEIASWEDIVISLPNPTADYYIAFEGKSNYGRGVTLDDIFVDDPNSGVVFSDDFDDVATNNFDAGPKMIGVSADNPDVVYVLEANFGIFGGFYKSTDSGTNFISIDHSGKNYFGYSSNADDDRGQAPRDMDIIVNPSDSEDVHIAGILSWRSTNGGIDFDITSQWVPQNAVNENIGYCHADIDIMIYHNDKIFVGSDGGIFIANDPLNVSSTYYTDLTTGLGIRQFYKIGISQTDPVIVSGGSQDNGTSVYRADGIWYDWLGADGMETFIDHSNPNILYGTSQFGSLYKSINQGASRFGLQTPDDKSGNWVTPFEQDPNDSNTIYSGYDQIYKSTNGGQSLISGEQSWVPISQNFEGNANHLKIAPSNTNVMYAAYGENLYKTSNGGSNGDWTQLTGFFGYINSIAIHPTNPNKIAIVTSSSDKVYISSDGGQNWSVVTYDLPSFSALALVWDITYGEDVLYLGMNYGIYYLRANETTWTPYDTALPNVQIRELEINTADNKLYAATYGRGLWRVNLFDPTSLSVDDLQFSDLILSPNPSTGTFKLNWKRNTQVTIKIYDTLGKLVFYEKNRDLTQNSEINLQVQQGLYFLKVYTKNHEVTKKLIVN
jgi:photosystem II stability/assembly factor-like uncharacterized protein